MSFFKEITINEAVTHHQTKKIDRSSFRTCRFFIDNSRVAEYTDILLHQALQGTFPLRGLF